MNIKTPIISVLIGTGSLLIACGKKIPQKVISQSAPKIETDINFQTILKDTFNHVMSDENKVIEYNKLLKKYNFSSENYIVIDKNNCVSKVYRPDGKLLYQCEVALGRQIGDKRSGGYGINKAIISPYTTPGEFIVRGDGTKNIKDQKLYGERVMVLVGDHTLEKFKGKAVLALHRVPSAPQGRLRENVFENKTLKDNRVSFGCVNYLVKSYDKMRNLIKGKGTRVYILPEEKGNSLHLERQEDGTYKFFQTKYRYESQEKNN